MRTISLPHAAGDVPVPQPASYFFGNTGMVILSHLLQLLYKTLRDAFAGFASILLRAAVWRL